MLERLESSVYRRLKGGAFLGLFLALTCLGCNPFAPALEEVDLDPTSILGNRKTINGTFGWFQSSYDLRDSTLYGQIIHQDFVFTYYDFANGNNVQWDRQTEMTATYRMFSQVKSASLQWNHYLWADTSVSDTLASMERAFNLVIVQDDQNIFRGTGSAVITLQRGSPDANWKIKGWVDRSDF